MTEATQSENIRILTELIVGKSLGKVTYEGGAEGYALYSGKDCVVQRAFLKKGYLFPEHIHEVVEVVVVLSGKLQSTVASLTTITTPTGIVCFPPKVAHSVFAETDCWVIGILIPYGVGYPEVLPVKD